MKNLIVALNEFIALMEPALDAGPFSLYAALSSDSEGSHVTTMTSLNLHSGEHMISITHALLLDFLNCAEKQGDGELAAKFRILLSTCEEIFEPVARERGTVLGGTPKKEKLN